MILVTPLVAASWSGSRSHCLAPRCSDATTPRPTIFYTYMRVLSVLQETPSCLEGDILHPREVQGTWLWWVEHLPNCLHDEAHWWSSCTTVASLLSASGSGSWVIPPIILRCRRRAKLRSHTPTNGKRAWSQSDQRQDSPLREQMPDVPSARWSLLEITGTTCAISVTSSSVTSQARF
jgi:hypothetical protein